MSTAVAAAELPPGALLERYRTAGGYVDCFVADVAQPLTLPQLVQAFYNSRAFRFERWLLGVLLGKRADADDVLCLAAAETQHLSAWSVEARTVDQILMCDFQSKTRSWLMVLPLQDGTRLHFGTAVVPAQSRADKAVFTALLGFHRWYSRALLGSTVKQLQVLGVTPVTGSGDSGAGDRGGTISG